MCQTRSRVYIIMVQQVLASPAQMTQLAHIVTTVLPGSIANRAVLQQVRGFVVTVLRVLGETPIEHPAAKDPVGTGRVSE